MTWFSRIENDACKMFVELPRRSVKPIGKQKDLMWDLSEYIQGNQSTNEWITPDIGEIEVNFDRYVEKNQLDVVFNLIF